MQIALETMAPPTLLAPDLSADAADAAPLPPLKQPSSRPENDEGDCPFGVGGTLQRDNHGRLLTRGDHICRQAGGSGRTRVQHGLYVGGEGCEQVIYFRPMAPAAQPHAAPAGDA